MEHRELYHIQAYQGGGRRESAVRAREYVRKKRLAVNYIITDTINSFFNDIAVNCELIADIIINITFS